MAEVVDTFELRHVSTTYSEDKDGNTLTHFNCRVMLPDLDYL